MTPEFRRQFGEERAAVSHLIRHEMRLRGYSGRSLAEALGCSDVLVYRTICGTSHSPRVLDALHELGVPAELLFDPRLAEIPSLTTRRKHKERV